jgi:CRISP-associated protein Cas1
VKRDLSPKELKSILHSKRANIYYLEHCRVLVNGGRVEYVTEQGRDSLYWNIPIANTTTLLLGTGTSVTQAAVRELAKAGVMLGFCGGGGSPLFAATDIEWMTPQSEYRPTEYMQKWVAFWFSEKARLSAAKSFQQLRLKWVQAQWTDRHRRDPNFPVSLERLEPMLQASSDRISSVEHIDNLLAEEARLTKALYKLAVDTVGYGDFTRAKQGSGADPANRFLDHGNYLAYGLAATAAWVLGIPVGLAVLHGKTRRGGLVFDIADLVKDAIVLPQAFAAAKAGAEDQEFRVACIDALTRAEALDFMVDTVKEIALTTEPL